MGPKKHSFRILRLTLCIGLLPALNACSPLVNAEAAPDAHNPACASVMILLPQRVGEYSQRETNAQGTKAWGDPANIILRCGVEPLQPTSDRCVSVDGVDWILREDDESWIFTTYGKDPAVEIVLRGQTTSGTTVLNAFSSAVRHLKTYTACL